MKVEKLAAWAEIISSIAIVLTLVYLSIQTQQNTDAIDSAVRQSMLESDVVLLTSGEGILLADPDNLPEEKLTQYLATYIAFARSRENIWSEFQAGNLDEYYFASQLYPFVGTTFGSDFAKELWQAGTLTNGFRPGFIDYVNTAASERGLLTTRIN